MVNPSEGPSLRCSNCGAEMERRELQGIYGREVDVDLCFQCRLMWLDKRESIQLAPRGTLDLFRALHERHKDPRHSLSQRMACPRCATSLGLTHDIGKGGRFSYYSCPRRHGRLTPFSEFLKEKAFVRALNPAEQQKLRASVKQVQCSSCGAPVDLGQGFGCQHCGSPLTVLDPNAVEETLRELEQADAEHDARTADPAAAQARARAIAALETLRTDPDFREGYQVFSWSSGSPRRHSVGSITVSAGGDDLLSYSIGKLFGGGM